VARQFCGQLGQQDNCQVAVTLVMANDAASLPIPDQLYLLEPWAGDRKGTASFDAESETGTDPEASARANASWRLEKMTSP